MPEINDNEEYKETSLAIAAALYSIGYEFLRLECTEKRGQRAFVFSDLPPYEIGNWPRASLLAKDYDQHILTVDAKKYFGAVKDLKDMVWKDKVQGE